MTPCVDATFPQYSIDDHGYPRLHDPNKGNSSSAVRVLWEKQFGPIPNGYEPDHLCRNKLCINLDHIDVVTKEENNRRAHAKLSARQVMHIRARLAAGETKASLARRFGVAFMTITYIERRITWIALPEGGDICPVNNGLPVQENRICCDGPHGCWAGSN